MIREQEQSGLPREVVLMKYVLYLSRVRRNWIEQEVRNRAKGFPPSHVLGETYEVPTLGTRGPEAPFHRLDR